MVKYKYFKTRKAADNWAMSNHNNYDIPGMEKGNWYGNTYKWRVAYFERGY